MLADFDTRPGRLLRKFIKRKLADADEAKGGEGEGARPNALSPLVEESLSPTETAAGADS